MDASKPGPPPPPGPPPEAAHEHGGVRAEPDVVPARVVVGFAVVLTVLCVASVALMVLVFRVMEKRAEKRDARAVSEAGLERRPGGIPPAPRLQLYAPRHRKDFQEAERERLASYGWMDRSTGVVHVPIERAMDLIAVRGVAPLPAAPVAGPAPAATPGKGAKR